MAVLAAGVLYTHSLANSFVNYDDPVFVLAPQTGHGLTLESLSWALTSRDQQNWIPLARLFWIVERSLFGHSPVGWHAISLILHAGATALALWAWRRHTGTGGAALCAGVVFAGHPLQVEAVSWATAQKDGLAALGALAALGWSSGFRARRYWAALALAASLLAKPAALLLPVYLLAVTPGTVRQRLARHWPLLAAAIGGAVGAAWAGAAAAAVDQPGHAQVLSFWHAPLACLKYITAFLWPVGLCYHHPLPAHPPVAAGLASAAGLLAITSWCWCRRQTNPLVWKGWLWFLLLFLPGSGLIAFGPQGWAERFGYLAITGLGVALWPGLRWLAGRQTTDQRRFLILGTMAGLILLWAGLAWRQQGFWHDSETLFRRAIAVGPPSALPHFHLATTLEARGHSRDATAELTRALEIDPGFLPARYNLACSHMARREFAAALEAVRPVAAGHPRWAEAHLVLANALYETGDHAGALLHYEEAARLKPSLPTAARNASVLRGILRPP